jgi:hypothetical protein
MNFPQDEKFINKFEQWYQEDTTLLPAILHTESNNVGIRKNLVNWRTSKQEREELKRRDEELFALIRFIAKKLKETKP